jgi:valacyclovir hydrolase
MCALIFCHTQAFVADEDIEAYEKYEDVSKWQPAARAEGEAIYGAENLQKGWSGTTPKFPCCSCLSRTTTSLCTHFRCIEMLQKLRSVYDDDGDLYCGLLPRIKCKTLVVAGAKDKLVQDFHGEYLSERIMHSRLHLFSNGRHDLHISEAREFNELLDTFLQEPDDKLTQSREFVARPMP